MAMRELISGGAACAVEGSSSSSNPFGALANAILGSSMKAQDLKGLPESQVTVPNASSGVRSDTQLTTIPGSEYESQLYQQPDAQSSEFLRNFRSVGHGNFEDAWDEIQQPPAFSHVGGRVNDGHLAEFEQIYDSTLNSSPHQTWDGPPQRVLSSFLHYFVNSDRDRFGFHPTALPPLGLSNNDKQCIRDRSCIMARHIFADKSEQYINDQVIKFLHCLDIDNDQLMRGPLQGHHSELEKYWNDSQVGLRPVVPQPVETWVSEFSQQRERGDPEAWVHSFENQHGANGWVSEFEQEQAQMASVGQLGGSNLPNIAIEQTRMLAHTLSQNSDPKFQNSKFLQFVSKMSRGELIVDDNQIKPASETLSGDWANEFQMQYNKSSSSWVDQFSSEGLSKETNNWVNEFTKERHLELGEDQWVNEFSKLHVQDWAEEFGQQVAEGAFEESAADRWADAYDEFLDGQLASKQKSSASRGLYVFSDMNPYVGHPNPLKEGQELFRKGLLSEAVLALEAEVMKNPDNAEGWRLLGITHAENDDDQQAIASMMRAQEADPANLEVLLALGVSYTNELEQEEALRYLYKWLQNHPKYGSLAPPELSTSLFHADIARLFNEAARMSPEDADVHIVLGVMYNVSREYDRAIESFKTALKLKPHDYSLWNKLGATQANSVHSEDAILAYQQALDLKPNYVRAWANMGISYANQGRYEESVRYYVRALSMNPKADNAWQYLRISLRFASRTDMLEACDARNLDVLLKEFPL
ncbi:Peroxisome biogenesis protein 5 [Apostasia shenzhenica]|uniref:Peroxisome biogenesis protein 5 n=1 Tax=Apostasia shenzhenica TaxID=1088818 RepID=A0A2I0A4M4_9ASPA|nr:Peroxisome biogenesis protein 5 [Apostasia shenzhenica]